QFPAIELNAVGRTAYLPPVKPIPAGRGNVLLVTAGTSDLPVAEEAAVTAAALGNCVSRLVDVGVAGIHRLLARREELIAASVIVVVAGMDGALPSVIGGLVRVPVIAVPTSIGYGASFHGLAALLTMLNSCAAGVTVVNTVNGFGSGGAARRTRRSPCRVPARSLYGRSELRARDSRDYSLGHGRVFRHRNWLGLISSRWSFRCSRDGEAWSRIGGNRRRAPRCLDWRDPLF